MLRIAGACFVLCVTTVIWLLGTARHGAATAVAWFPALVGLRHGKALVGAGL